MTIVYWFSADKQVVQSLSRKWPMSVTKGFCVRRCQSATGQQAKWLVPLNKLWIRGWSCGSLACRPTAPPSKRWSVTAVTSSLVLKSCSRRGADWHHKTSAPPPVEGSVVISPISRSRKSEKSLRTAHVQCTCGTMRSWPSTKLMAKTKFVVTKFKWREAPF